MKKKQLLVMVAMMLVVAMVSVAGTIAFLTSAPDPVKNTFAVGAVEIVLNEAPVNTDGEVITGDRRTENEYQLYPNHSYTKDPTIFVDADSERCFLYVEVNNGIAAIEDSANTIAAQMTANGWTAIAEGSNIYYYREAVDANAQVKVFEKFKIASNVTSTQLADYANAEITIQAYAIQEDGFEGAPLAAWAAAQGELRK